MESSPLNFLRRMLQVVGALDPLPVLAADQEFTCHEEFTCKEVVKEGQGGGRFLFSVTIVEVFAKLKADPSDYNFARLRFYSKAPVLGVVEHTKGQKRPKMTSAIPPVSFRGILTANLAGE